ncbi:hypothetical protein ACP70R_002565 [Stipagrostis hirtigluma subsp. patula]
MISRPFFGDQFGNARFVCDVWRVGVEVKVETQLQRGQIKVAIEKLMGDKEWKEVRGRIKDLKSMAEKGIKEGGLSHAALVNLVDLILSF